MEFYIKERNAWIRSCTHTMVLDTDPDFHRFVHDDTGKFLRRLRIWVVDEKKINPVFRAYLGSAVFCDSGLSIPEVYSLFRRVAGCKVLQGKSRNLLRQKRSASIREHFQSASSTE